ncbi:HD domain-containing phosphohydrolase [Butyrivibrio sp. VCB2006]|uniref:HD domain-containing phosphohydrolase n=1 Tax=Butyrivibrio sp. VCB2006 TaxID=1280679 RepID=UPI000408A31E|nr:HD domain-containing phosphohydrolase [Butyrivibrio sp. VCB2006]
MKNWKTWQIALFIAACVCLNVVGRLTSNYFELPLWADSFGTALCAYAAGPICGAIVGVTGNLSYSAINSLSAAYSITSIVIALIIGYAVKKRWFDRYYGFMKAASFAILAALVVSVPVNILFDNGYTGNKWGNGVVDFLLDRDWPPFICTVLGQLALEFVDKIITVFLVYMIIKVKRWRREQEEDKKMHHGSAAKTAAKTAIVLCLSIGLSMCLFINAKASGSTDADAPDYNDYVQTIYSSNNGLPCGEANDIAQTNDGILWIGTYAGLYRYNGREFRWVDDYDSVKNVNCLYVDEEGRLWIGTNDNGLSIAIREKVVNVLDEKSGLSSDSVRSIIRATDGYYYIGTSGSMQIIAMNNGLKVVDTLEEVYYADSIAADNNGHVAAIASDGHLFLLKNGKIKSNLKPRQADEVFNCCAFAPDGTLMAGSSKDHIFSYDVSGDGLIQTDVMTCEGLDCITDLTFIDDETMFITSDSGVAYVNKVGYNLLNTNEFNNSIDNMLYDYQGNLWFTSSRLGLLRLAKSPFRDIYGAIGMERKVVNTIVSWRGNYYIGTDKGLDIVDKTCHRQVNNELTTELEDKRIRCMYVDGDDHLWVCTYGSGLIEYAPNGKSWFYNADTGSFGNRARVVTGLSDGTILAAGDSGISYIKDHKVIKTIQNDEDTINSMILTLTERSDGTILAGTDGDGIAVLKDGKVSEMLTREDGLSSSVILRTVKDPKSEGVFIVTSNSLCYLDENGTIKVLEKFPYFNNYDIWVKDEDTLFVMSSAGIYVVERDELVEGGEIAWELLDARRGLGTSLTANSWNYYNGNGELLLPCDTGVYLIDVDKYNSDVRSYRMQIASLKLDGVQQPIARKGAITVGRGISRVEMSPEILNYTIQEPNVGYLLEGYDTQWTIVPQNNLNNIIYINLPAGTYTFHLAIFDSAGEKVLEERKFDIVKVGEIYENKAFLFYMLILLCLILVWFTWLVVQRQINQQQIKLNMANETVMAIANAVDAKDVRTHEHSQRVAEYSVLIAEEMNCFKWWEKKRALSSLKKAAQMHDIGKIGVPDSVLNKVGRLTDEEYGQMKSHVVRGGDILKDFTLVDHVEDGTRYHHERYDGKGYPDGLKGKEIPLFGRIIGVADAFDAMTSNRVYRNHMDTSYVMNEIIRGRGTQFDPDAADAFIRLVGKGVIDLDKIYAEKTAELQKMDQGTQDELTRRVEEDKKIQENQMKEDIKESSKEEKGAES